MTDNLFLVRELPLPPDNGGGVLQVGTVHAQRRVVLSLVDRGTGGCVHVALTSGGVACLAMMLQQARSELPLLAPVTSPDER